MAITCPVDLDTLKLRAEIQSMYARVAENPSGKFHFHRGPAYAARRLNYDAAELSRLPGMVTESFAGVGNPHAAVRLLRGHVEGEDGTAVWCHRRESVSDPQ
jgi:hypothetical protein